MRKIIVFGGSFDPPHLGHQLIYTEAVKQIQPDLVVIIPTKYPNLKTQMPIASPEQRFQMASIAFADQLLCYVSRLEINSKKHGYSYTYRTLKRLRKQYKHEQLYLLIGSDRFHDFEKWKKHEYILKHANLLVFNRPGQEPIKDIKNKNVQLLDIPTFNISSTELRTFPQQNAILQGVREYIGQNFLYVNQQVEALLSKERYEHCVRVANLAVEICKGYDPFLVKEAYAAGMYHDIAKELDDTQIKDLVKDHDTSKYPNIHCMHGLASALFIEKNYSITNKLVLKAITNHVIPMGKPTLLDMILFCADKLEPARTKEDVSDREMYLKLVKKDIFYAYDKLLRETKGKYRKC